MTSSSDSIHRSDDAARPSHALQGASLAFSSPLAPLERSPNTYSGTNGALAAASFAGLKPRSTADRQLHTKGASPSPRSSGLTKDHGVEEKGTRIAQRQSHGGFSGAYESHAASNRKRTSREQSPSYIAAMVAAGKPATRDIPSQTTPRSDQRRPSPLHRHSDYPALHTSRVSSLQRPTDETPIATTNSLVKLYESIRIQPGSTTEAQVRNDGPLIISPKPIRPSTLGRLSLQDSESFSAPREKAKKRGNTVSYGIDVPKVGATAAAAAAAKPAKSKIQSVAYTRGPPPVPPPPRKAIKRPTLPAPQQSQTSVFEATPSISSSSSYTSALDRLASPRKELLGLTLHDGAFDADDIKTSFALSEPDPKTSIHTNTVLKEHSPSRPTYNKSSRSFDGPIYGPTPSLRPPMLSTTSLAPQLTLDSLANAMVASSLASSRAPSPTKPRLPPPRRHGKPHGLFHRSHSAGEASRTPSPAKQLRQTLRTTRKVEEEEQAYKAKRSHFMKKHPNKHHEGDRKRWRDTITEVERKRYAGVWAANKNLLHLLSLESEDLPADTVLGIIVRDIWHRSRLPDDVLEEVWTLVDMTEPGSQAALGKEEFVVGMWLIDQRLKGRKLPTRVSESVWGSVRMLSGVKVPKQRR